MNLLQTHQRASTASLSVSPSSCITTAAGHHLPLAVKAVTGNLVELRSCLKPRNTIQRTAALIKYRLAEMMKWYDQYRGLFANYVATRGDTSASRPTPSVKLMVSIYCFGARSSDVLTVDAVEETHFTCRISLQARPKADRLSRLDSQRESYDAVCDTHPGEGSRGDEHYMCSELDQSSWNTLT